MPDAALATSSYADYDNLFCPVCATMWGFDDIGTITRGTRIAGVETGSAKCPGCGAQLRYEHLRGVYCVAQPMENADV